MQKQLKIRNYLAEKLAELDTIKADEYKPKVVKGELEWEPESFFGDDEPILDSVIPDKILDVPKPGNKYAGKMAHTPTAKASRQRSNTVRSFIDY